MLIKNQNFTLGKRVSLHNLMKDVQFPANATHFHTARTMRPITDDLKPAVGLNFNEYGFTNRRQQPGSTLQGLSTLSIKPYHRKPYCHVVKLIIREHKGLIV